MNKSISNGRSFTDKSFTYQKPLLSSWSKEKRSCVYRVVDNDIVQKLIGNKRIFLFRRKSTSVIDSSKLVSLEPLVIDKVEGFLSVWDNRKQLIAVLLSVREKNEYEFIFNTNVSEKSTFSLFVYWFSLSVLFTQIVGASIFA